MRSKNMKKLVKIKAIKDRPALSLLSGDELQLELEGDMLVQLYREQALGLIKVEEIEQQ